jgi:hypothetical protein
LDRITWSLLASDIYLWDSGEMAPGDLVQYTMQTRAEKWLDQVSLPVAPPGRYASNLFFYDSASIAYLSLRDLQPAGDPEEAPDLIPFTWNRFGVSELAKVPAWRQALFGALTLMSSNLAAAVVLIAAGFEAYFTDATRIAWVERDLDLQVYKRVRDRNMAMTNLVVWLPEVVGLPNFIDAPGNLYSRWQETVNSRRNAVVHDARVHLTLDEARESLRTALESITFLDRFALTRPHSYYTSR